MNKPILCKAEPALLPQLNRLCHGIDYTLVVSNDEASPCFNLTAAGLNLICSPLAPFNLTQFYTEFIARRRPGVARELLVQALKLKPTSSGQVLDLTAGFGRDALLLALAGLKVVMLEQNPWLVICLRYLCQLLALPNLQVVYTDNYSYLQTNLTQFEYIYFDPMFEQAKTALAKKEMQIISILLAQYETKVDNLATFELALTRCQNKLIVKRDNKQSPLVTVPKPTFSQQGKTVRFDVYQLAHARLG